MNDPTPNSETNAKNHDWLRWTLPPGVSIVVHAGLIGAVAYVGMQISAQHPPKSVLPMAELALPAPPPQNTSPTPDTPAPESKREHSPTAVKPSELEHAAANLGSLKFTKPAMDPIALEALRTSTAQIARPKSATPPSVRFAGVQTQAARTIVYVVDGSGATANSFAYLQAQLQSSIDQLSPTQRFQVVLFRSINGTPVSDTPINHGKLARATAQNKQAVGRWLDTITTRGRSNPLDGLRSAIALKPDLVLLITRSIQRTEMGWAQGEQEILDELNAINPQNPRTGRRKTTIKTIQLLDEDPTGIMQAIGRDQGDGTSDYRVVTYDDLISPETNNDLSQRSIGASNEQRISTASEIMSSLSASGTSFSVFYAYGDRTQRERANQGARQIQSLVRRLISVDGRAAILDAQATLLLAIINPSISNTPGLEAIISSLDNVMYTEPNTDAQRVLTVARAMVQLGQTEHARSRIVELLSIADELGLDESTRAQASLALIALGNSEGADITVDRLDELSTQMPFMTRDGSIDAVWGLLLREAATVARLHDGQADPWKPIIELRASARNNESIRNYIDTRIALILSSTGAPPADQSLPNVVLLAAANTMSHSMDQRERAMDLLEQIAMRQDDPEQASDALWRIGVLGRAINTPEADIRSAHALTELATRYREHEHADDAIAGAIHATGIHLTDLRRDRLMLGVTSYGDHPQIDLWRLELAELLNDFAVLDVLDLVSPNTREGVLAGELYEQTVLEMMDRYDDPQIRRGLGIRMSHAAVRFGIDGASLWTKRAAMSEIEHDPQSAIASIDRLIADALDEKKPTDELELMRAQTLNTLGQTRSAFEALSRLSTRIDSTGNHTSTYWQAWALMLETIVENGSDLDRKDAARHIARLMLIDEKLGGSPWAQRIIASRQMLHSSP